MSDVDVAGTEPQGLTSEFLAEIRARCNHTRHLVMREPSKPADAKKVERLTAAVRAVAPIVMAMED